MKKQIPPDLWEHTPGCPAQLYPNAMLEETRKCTCGTDTAREKWVKENEQPTEDTTSCTSIEESVARLGELLADDEFAIFQGEWVSKEWGEEHFGDIAEGEFVSLCTPEVVKYLLRKANLIPL